jgi:hypothetical protein
VHMDAETGGAGCFLSHGLCRLLPLARPAPLAGRAGVKGAKPLASRNEYRAPARVHVTYAGPPG